MIMIANNPEKQFTLFRKNMLTNIEHYFIEPLEPEFKAEVRTKIAEAFLRMVI